VKRFTILFMQFNSCDLIKLNLSYSKCAFVENTVNVQIILNTERHHLKKKIVCRASSIILRVIRSSFSSNLVTSWVNLYQKTWLHGSPDHCNIVLTICAHLVLPPSQIHDQNLQGSCTFAKFTHAYLLKSASGMCKKLIYSLASPFLGKGGQGPNSTTLLMCLTICKLNLLDMLLSMNTILHWEILSCVFRWHALKHI
jgi:hypothetical protein